jgi:hypothetical protein
MSTPETINREDLFIELSGHGRWYPNREDNPITVNQVAHSLSSLARFTGHARRLNGCVYTVAEHSVKVSYLVSTLTALMHDAHECITNDLSKPIKVYAGGSYTSLEKDTEKQFAKRFGLQYPHGPEIKRADIIMVMLESRDLLTSEGRDWGYYEEYSEIVDELYSTQPDLRPQCWSPDKAERKFLMRFLELSQ